MTCIERIHQNVSIGEIYEHFFRKHYKNENIILLRLCHLYYFQILLSIGIFLEREDTLAAETKSPMQTFAVSDISSLSFFFFWQSMH